MTDDRVDSRHTWARLRDRLDVGVTDPQQRSPSRWQCDGITNLATYQVEKRELETGEGVGLEDNQGGKLMKCELQSVRCLWDLVLYLGASVDLKVEARAGSPCVRSG